MALRLPRVATARIRRLSGAVLACRAADQGVRRAGACSLSIPHPGCPRLAASGARAGAAAEEGGLACPVRRVNVQAVRLPGSTHRAAAGPALPASARAGARQLVPRRELSAAPDGQRRRHLALAKLGGPPPPRRGRLHDRAVASGLAGRPAVAAAVDPPQLPAPPGHLPPPAHRQHPAGDADRRRPARDVHRDRPPKARGRRAAAYEGTAKPAWRFFGISSGPVRGPEQMHLVVQSPARDLPSATVRGGVTAERRRTGLRAEILSTTCHPTTGWSGSSATPGPFRRRSTDMPDTAPRKSSRWPARSSPTPEQPNTVKVYAYIAFLQYTTPEIRGDYALEGKAIVVGAFRHGASWNQVAGAAGIDLADAKRRWGTWPAAQPAKRAPDGRGRSWWTGRACNRFNTRHRVCELRFSVANACPRMHALWQTD